MKLHKKAWDRIFREEGKFFIKPQEDIPKLAEEWKKKGLKRILDVGCGAGRHVVCLAKRGFEVYGMDISWVGIRIAREWLKEEGLKAKLQLGDIYKKFPYPNEFFDAIICTRTLNHGKIEWIRRAIKEMHRVLKPNGYVFVTVHKHRGKKYIPKDKLYGIKWIAPRTYVILCGPEKGIPHYRFNKKILIKEFREAGFKVLDVWIDSNYYYCLLAMKKRN